MIFWQCLPRGMVSSIVQDFSLCSGSFNHSQGSPSSPGSISWQDAIHQLGQPAEGRALSIVVARVGLAVPRRSLSCLTRPQSAGSTRLVRSQGCLTIMPSPQGPWVLGLLSCACTCRVWDASPPWSIRNVLLKECSTLGSSGLHFHQAESSLECLSSFLSGALTWISCNRVLATFLEGTIPHTYTVDGLRKSAASYDGCCVGWEHSLVGYFALQKKIHWIALNNCWLTSKYHSSFESCLNFPLNSGSSAVLGPFPKMLSLIFYMIFFFFFCESSKNRPMREGVPFVFTLVDLNVQLLAIRLTWVGIWELFLFNDYVTFRHCLTSLRVKFFTCNVRLILFHWVIVSIKCDIACNMLSRELGILQGHFYLMYTWYKNGNNKQTPRGIYLVLWDRADVIQGERDSEVRVRSPSSSSNFPCHLGS